MSSLSFLDAFAITFAILCVISIIGFILVGINDYYFCKGITEKREQNLPVTRDEWQKVSDSVSAFAPEDADYVLREASIVD